MATPVQKIFRETIKLAIKNDASDIHFSSGKPPVLRILGELRQIDTMAMDHESLTALFMGMINETQQAYFHKHKTIDFAINFENLSRFRVNLFQQMNGISAAFRLVSNEIRSLQQLRMPKILTNLIQNKKGLILVTGPTGSGKSTTLAAMIHEINLKDREHIITIEDPIEYVHQAHNCLIHQREIGLHTNGFSSALRSALREDPDVILVGEMRDTDTISNALRAAETGHLVFSTLHTNSSADTIDRIINVFPAENHQQVRQLLSSTLISVISQRLVPRALEKDRVAILEILITTPGVKNLIREGKTHQIDSAIQTGAEWGMQSFERSLLDLKQNNVVSPQLGVNDYV